MPLSMMAMSFAVRIYQVADERQKNQAVRALSAILKCAAAAAAKPAA